MLGNFGHMLHPSKAITIFVLFVSAQAYVEPFTESFEEIEALDTFSVSDRQQIFSFLKIFSSDVKEQKSMMESLETTHAMDIPIGSLLGSGFTFGASNTGYIPIGKGWICWQHECVKAKCGKRNSSNLAAAKAAKRQQDSKKCKTALAKFNAPVKTVKAKTTKLHKAKAVRHASGKKAKKKVKKKVHLPKASVRDVLHKFSKGLKPMKFGKKVNKKAALSYFKKFIYTKYAKKRL